MAAIPNSIEGFIELVSRLPGLGRRSARRIVLHMLSNRSEMIKFGDSVLKAAQDMLVCACGNIDLSLPCKICGDERRDRSTLCIVKDISDIWAMERNNIYNGLYHAIGGVLNISEGKTPATLNIHSIKDRIREFKVSEVILALDGTLNGESTAHYIWQTISDTNVKITRLAHGMPVGAELDYMDDGTISVAMRMRYSMK
ncbi:Recombination protein RecR [Candidatus Cyrtobacter comes]|uniref:Recombination protein RecR n=1 Tax=Candidatus Cyrtobacter comes TaxID=675776 RepID=A0ABU5L7V4_9RICK|nr:recombination mediator RecR [Candidatus Cyrtobacter comes]MDZ5762211.1 Recombination protein RecR [Candidatus Cyrtobacter comes]